MMTTSAFMIHKERYVSIEKKLSPAKKFLITEVNTPRTKKKRSGISKDLAFFLTNEPKDLPSEKNNPLRKKKTGTGERIQSNTCM